MSTMGSGMRRLLRLRTSASGEWSKLREEPGNQRGGILRRLHLVGDDGSALVEFAMVLPLMLIVLTGAASCCLALYNSQELGYATANTSVLLAEEAGLISDPCASAVTSMTGALPNWTASKLTYTLSITDSTGTAHSYGPTKGSSFSCPAGSAEMDTNEPVELTVTYSYTWLPILDVSPASNITSTGSALMY